MTKVSVLMFALGLAVLAASTPVSAAALSTEAKASCSLSDGAVPYALCLADDAYQAVRDAICSSCLGPAMVSPVLLATAGHCSLSDGAVPYALCLADDAYQAVRDAICSSCLA